MPGFLDNLPHWYPLREHDATTGVELPKPTVLPPTIRTGADYARTGSPNLPRGAMGSPSRQHAYRVRKHWSYLIKLHITFLVYTII